MGRPRNWHVEVYDGDCDHKQKPPKSPRHTNHGTVYCPACTASRGYDGKWRVIVNDASAAARA